MGRHVGVLLPVSVHEVGVDVVGTGRCWTDAAATSGVIGRQDHARVVVGDYVGVSKGKGEGGRGGVIDKMVR